MSLLIMVAPEPSEPLLLYITATAEVMSMLLVAERLEPKQPQALKGSPTTGSRSQYPDLVEGPRNQEASGSQLPERRTPNQVPAFAGALGSQGPRSF
jgi:hypothetical protein